MTPSAALERPKRPSASVTEEGTIHAIGIAGIKIVKAPDRVRTVLGSCVGVALIDPAAGVGGLAHVMLPNSHEGSGDPGKFADTAVDLLLGELLSASAVRRRVIAKTVGGAVMFGDACRSTLGRRNAEAVEARLRHHAIRLAASALGGHKGRKMLLDPATGDVHVEIIGTAAEII